VTSTADVFSSFQKEARRVELESVMTATCVCQLSTLRDLQSRSDGRGFTIRLRLYWTFNWRI